MFRAQAVHVTTPATSANLGPGFDTFGLALSLRDDLVAQVTDEPGLTVDVAGEGAGVVRTDEKNLVVRAMRAGFKALGGQPRGLAVVCANRIPHGRGLGSSAAAIVSGLIAARWLTVGGEDRLPDNALLALATSLEGHADNVAAAAGGQLSLAWTGSSGAVRALTLPVLPDIRAGRSACRRPRSPPPRRAGCSRPRCRTPTPHSTPVARPCSSRP